MKLAIIPIILVAFLMPFGLVLAQENIVVPGVTIPSWGLGGSSGTGQQTATLTPVLAISLSSDKSRVVPDEAFTYQIRYKNIGSGPADNVVIELNLPEGTEPVRALPLCYVLDNREMTFNIGRVEPEQEGILNIGVSVAKSADRGDELEANIRADYDDLAGGGQKRERDELVILVDEPGAESGAAALGFLSFSGFSFFLNLALAAFIIYYVYYCKQEMKKMRFREPKEDISSPPNI